MLAGIENNQDLEIFLAAFLSRFRLAQDPMPPPDEIKIEEVLHALESGRALFRNPWTRLTWVETVSGARLYAAGQPFDCSVALAEALCKSRQPLIGSELLDRASLNTVADLINNGHFLLTD
jgi:50S ribosomal protein L16 3-hydroxylase